MADGRTRYMLALRNEDGLTFREIGEAVGVSAARAAQIIDRERKRRRPSFVAARLKASSDSPEGFFWRDKDRLS